MERRNHSAGLRIKRENEVPKIFGYASVFYNPDDPGTQFRLWGNVVERVAPTAFSEALQKDDVRGLFNHNPDQILGRVKAGTMRLSVDQVGLLYEITPPDTQTAKELIAAIERGDITGSSFSFIPRSSGVVWSEEETVDGFWYEVRTLTNVELLDVGPVTFPAYSAASSGLRSIDLEFIRKEHAEFRQKTKPANWLVQINERADAVARLEKTGLDGR